MRIFLACFPMHLDKFLNQIGKPSIYLAQGMLDMPRATVIAQELDEPMKILTSFHYFRDKNFDDLLAEWKMHPIIFADSGAFSAASQGASISVGEYAEWIHRWKGHLSIYSNLDVIRDPVASQKNQERLEREGLNPIPVFHTGSPFEYLDELAERYPYIALGGMVGQSRPACLRWAATCMKRTEHLGTRFHGFGMTSKEVVERLPWGSVDSSSWAGVEKFGNIRIFDGREWHQADIGEKEKIRFLAPLIREYGFDPDQFMDKARYTATKGHLPNTIMSALSWHRYEKFLQRKHSRSRMRG